MAVDKRELREWKLIPIGTNFNDLAGQWTTPIPQYWIVNRNTLTTLNNEQINIAIGRESRSFDYKSQDFDLPICWQAMFDFNATVWSYYTGTIGFDHFMWDKEKVSNDGQLYYPNVPQIPGFYAYEPIMIAYKASAVLGILIQVYASADKGAYGWPEQWIEMYMNRVDIPEGSTKGRIVWINPCAMVNLRHNDNTWGYEALPESSLIKIAAIGTGGYDLDTTYGICNLQITYDKPDLENPYSLPLNQSYLQHEEQQWYYPNFRRARVCLFRLTNNGQVFNSIKLDARLKFTHKNKDVCTYYDWRRKYNTAGRIDSFLGMGDIVEIKSFVDDYNIEIVGIYHDDEYLAVEDNFTSNDYYWQDRQVPGSKYLIYPRREQSPRKLMSFLADSDFPHHTYMHIIGIPEVYRCSIDSYEVTRHGEIWQQRSQQLMARNDIPVRTMVKINLNMATQ